MKKRIILVLIVVMMFTLLCGCKSEVIFTYSPGDEKSYYYLEFAFDNDELVQLNNSAVQNNRRISGTNLNGTGINVSSGTIWTVELYLKVLMARFSNFIEEEKTENEDYTIYAYSFEMENPAIEEEDDEDKPDIKTGFLFYTITIEQDNPFNSYKAEYLGQSITGSPIDAFKNGAGVLIPSFKYAFPAFIATQDINLNYYLQSNLKLYMKDRQVEYDSYGNRYYLFKTSLNSKDDKIVFEYYRANTLGWNLIAVLSGLAVIGIILLICKFSPPKKPKFQQTNYDYFSVYKKNVEPFGSEYEKNNGNRNSGNNSTADKDKNNPFSGY